MKTRTLGYSRLVDCHELLVCFVNVPHEPIEDRVMAQAADQFPRPGGLQFFIKPVIVLYMLGFAKSDEPARSENAEVRRFSFADFRSGEPLALGRASPNRLQRTVPQY